MSDGSLEKILQQADYSSICFQLRFDDDFLLPAYGLLRLRRELNRLLKAGAADNGYPAYFRNLLQPALPTDPVLLRRVQQPAPGFVLRIDNLKPQRFLAGELLSIPVCFFARGMTLVEPFTRLLEALGPVGLCGKSGRFQLEAIQDDSELADSGKLWSGGPFPIALTISDLTRQAVERSAATVKFELMTPARLLKNSRPLFRAEFMDIFPFILRRVTGMLAVWADLEESFDTRHLLECASSLSETENRLSWLDWRPLQQHDEAGGLRGSVCLSGDQLAELLPILRIGELLGIGKGAAFGAGRYRLS